MSHGLAIAVFALVPCIAAAVLGRPAVPLLASAFALAAAGEEAGWWHASWILGEGWLGHAIGVAAAVLYALPPAALGLVVRARARRRSALG